MQRADGLERHDQRKEGTKRATMPVIRERLLEKLLP